MTSLIGTTAPTRTLIAVLAVGVMLSAGACGSRGGEKEASSTPNAVRSAFGPNPAAGTTPPTGARSGSPTASATTPVPHGNPRSGSASLQEPGNDALKTPTAPAYAEIRAAAIRGASRSITFTLTLAEDLPAKTADANTTMKAGFRVKIGETVYVLTATLSSTGLATTATKDGTSTPISAAYQRRGAALTLAVPWTFFGGVQTFAWTGFSAWDQTTSTSRSYSVDIIPNAGEAPYPMS